MALKIVPAGDERCDIHNRRESPRYICETCLKEFGIDYEVPATAPATASRSSRRRGARRTFRRWRSGIDRKVLIGAAVGAILVIALIALAGGGGGGGGGGSAGPTEADVVNALDLVPDLNRGGWVTVDGACAVVSIQLGNEVPPGSAGVAEALNENRTVGALVLQNDFSISQAQCVDRIGAALKAHF